MPSERNERTAVKRVLVYRLGSLGDMLVALPAFRLARHAFPQAEVRLLTNMPVSRKAPPAAAVLEGTGLVDGYMRYGAGTRQVRELLALWWRILRWRPEVVVYLAPARGVAVARRDQRFFRLCGVRRIVGAPVTEAMQANFGGLAPAEVSAERRARGPLEHEAARLARNIAELGDARLQDPESWSLDLGEAELQVAEQAMGSAGRGQRWLAVSVGTKVQAKDWGAENWRALLQEVARRFPQRGLLLAGAAEESTASEFAAEGWRAGGGGCVVNLCGKLTPRQSAAAFAQAQLFVGHDSGPMHLAAAVGTPCVAIFAARNVPRQWFPFGKQHQVVYHAVECMGCGLETCIEQGKKCLLSITVAEVLAGVEAVLRSCPAEGLVATAAAGDAMMKSR